LLRAKGFYDGIGTRVKVSPLQNIIALFNAYGGTTEQFQLPLLQTKLYIPATRSDLVARPRLVTRLNTGLHPPTKVMLISAPAGFGKTTLVSSWLHQVKAHDDGPVHVAWLSLDENDNAPLQFLHYVIAALQTVKPGIGKPTLAAAQSSPDLSLETLTTHLINELATFSPRIVLVLDDYHTITAVNVHQMINFLIGHLPPNVHLLISTREDPPLALSRLRVRQELIELRAADLRFTEAETAAFLNDLMALALTPDDVAALESRTEGWIAGLQLAALSLRSTADKSDFVRAFAGSHRFLTDYLVDEVLSRQPPAVQTFLRRTAILERFCASLCDAILEDTDSRETLRQLEQANLSLVPLDNARRWFRYHHLFADFLRVRLYENVGFPQKSGQTAKQIVH
jgi:LuxR family maltose regulon positive regulatory protein